jgi:hypothetical protein
MERARDRYGRPLRHDGDPSRIVPGVPERDVITGEQAWTEALDYLSQDLPFHAHEVFEQRWRCAPEDERACWQALAQWGAALTHRARGNTRGAQRVAERALHGLQQATGVPEIVDVQRVSESCADLLSD